ncbi:menaquinone biosynthesis decarboxylase [Metallumcola ferriviriculae]|uniref:Menaquinone biosynthesis decarboxylase n=1 Tax=Metallumcola ferriviriculae TaxID=3039180 RepID=A0AAU0UQT3_9FIRM|nr:menaquinone biosynthesis decarboxylase [Desulfitibacteraceae bacterium MK1]
MAFRDLQHFIEELDKRGELKRINAPVSNDLEITEITDRVSKDYGPALLFENVKGYDMPVLTNAYGSFERMGFSLGVEDLDDIGAEILTFLQPPEVPSSMIDKLKALPKVAQIANFMPKIVKKGICQEVVHQDPDLSLLPVLKCWPQDGGPFITLPLVFTKDPESGKRNVGMYRMQVFDSKTTGMHWHLHKHGADHYRGNQAQNQRMEVAVALGGDPAITYAATAPLPKDIDEMFFAGFLRKEPVELVKCKTVDIEVPAHAEIIIEGYIDPSETRLEGPFGDHTGYYSLADQYPVFHVTCITHRKNPVYPATIVGKPPQEDCYLGKATERIFLPLLKMQLPEIKDMNLPLEGVFHNCVILSIKKTYPKHAQKVMNAIWGTGQMMFTKMIIVVDETVDVQNLSEVAWKVFNNIDAKRDLSIVEGPLDILDHASPRANYGHKVGIDATKKWSSEGHTREWPDDIEMSDEIKQLVDGKWKEYGFTE